MKKSLKIWYLTAVGLLAFGLIFLLIGGLIIGFDVNKLDTASYVTKSLDIAYAPDASKSEIEFALTEHEAVTVGIPVKHIAIDAESCDVHILPAEVEQIVLEIKHTESEIVTADLTPDGTLSVSFRDTAAWYDQIGFDFQSSALKLYMPKAIYGDLTVNNVNGRVTTATSLQFENALIETVSGSIELRSQVRQRVDCSTVNGRIILADMDAGDMKLKTTNWELLLMDVDGKSLTAQTTNGNVQITAGDFDQMHIKTVNGSVSAYLLSPKNFVVHTVSGNVEMPDRDPNAGICEVRTTNGDVTLCYED